ncbi:MAG: T9SS type A sorting domain-containing protein, partial [Bacteroidia bacterium]|nr:T9SS type A sorting domain-containing protein [Bacteroidia bacterium]
FLVRGNGVVYDTFEYGEVSYEIGPLSGDCSTIYQFTVEDIDDPDCEAYYEFDLPVCCIPPECKIQVDDVVQLACDSSGFRQIQFSLITENIGSLGFDVFFMGVPIAHFDYGFNNYVISIPGNEFISLKVADTEFPDCFDKWIIDVSPCLVPVICNYNDFDITLEFECTSDTTYNALLFVAYTGTDDSLYVYLDDQAPELRAVKDFPVIYPDILVSNELYVFYAHEQDNPFCFNGTEWNDPPDCSNYTDCKITDVFAELHDCNTISNMQMVDIEFNVENPVSDSFIIQGNGVIFDTFTYGQLFYTVGPIEVDCQTNFEFIVVDLEEPNCIGEFVFPEAPCCECEYYDFVVDPGNCTGDGLYELYLDFEYENVVDDYFDVYSDGQFVGIYAYDDLPITIDEFPESENTFDIITICDNDNPDCCTDFEFSGPDCMQDECMISNVFAESTLCNDAGNVFVDIEFIVQNPGSQGFMILGNGVNYGSYQYGLATYTVGPIDGDCTTIYEFIIQDIENPDCSDFFEFDDPICCDLECEISNIVVNPVECTGDGLFSLFLNFQYENVQDNIFSVYSGNTFIGTYLYSSLPVLIQSFPESDNALDIITVCADNNPDCCETIEFSGLDCMEDDPECLIYDLSVDPILCTGDGLFSIWVEFAFQNPTNDFFDVFSGDQNIGTYPFSNVPLIIEDFPAGDDENELITICINDNEMCCAELEFQGLECVEECAIWDIVVDPIECTGDGLYSIVLDFEYEYNTNDFFEVFSSGVYLGLFPFEDLPVTILDFPERDAEYDIITVCQNDTDNCCASHEFIGLDCTEDPICLISDVEIELVECTGIGTYSMYLNFSYENVTNNFFEIFSDGNYVGTYAYEDLPVLIEAFPERNAEFDFIVICDNDNPACCSGFEFLGLNCEEEENCEITGIFAEAGECNDEGLAYVDIEFDVDNPGTLGFVIRGNGVLYDTFEYGQLFYTVGPVEGDCETLYEFLVIDLENPDCSSEYILEEEICCEMEECIIYDAAGEYYDCDSTTNQFFVDLAFEYENVGNSGFTVRGNGEVYDTFEYGQDFYTIGPLDADCVTVYEFIISDFDKPDCFDFFFFTEAVCCEEEVECSIDEIDIIAADCIDDVYIIEIDVMYTGIENSGFDLYLDEEFYSFHLFEDLPVEIEVSKNEFEAPFLMTVCENDNESCCNDILFEFELPDAINVLPEDSFKIRSNKQEIFIKTDLNDAFNASIFSIEGMKLHSEGFRNELYIGTETYGAGLYILVIESASGVFTKKIVMMQCN